MSKILTDSIIPELKGEVNKPGLKVYDIVPTAEGILSIVDNSLPSTPLEGMEFIVHPIQDVNGAPIKLSVNGSTATWISSQHIGENTNARPSMTYMQAYNYYLITWIPNGWRCLNVPAKIEAGDADVEGIMISAGANGQLFGLGGRAIAISGANLNDLQAKSGIYRGNNLVNAPSTDFYTILQIVYTPTYIYQMALPVYIENAVFVRGYTQEDGWRSWTKMSTPSSTFGQCYPVGSIYISSTITTAAGVATALGGGTWVSVSTNLGSGFYAYKRSA